MPTIELRGIMLYGTQNNQIVRVWFPDTTAMPIDGRVMKKDRLHVDRSLARTHYPTLLYTNAARAYRMNIDGCVLSFADPTQSIDKAAIESFVDIGQAGGNAGLKFVSNSNLCCRIELAVPATYSGAVSHSDKDVVYRLTSNGRAYHSWLELSFDDNVSLQIDSAVMGTRTVELSGAEKAIIGHLDRVYSTAAELEDDIKSSTAESVTWRDYDFCWLYSVLQPGTDTLGDHWGPGKPLPAPWAESTLSASFPSVSTCLPAQIGI